MRDGKKYWVAKLADQNCWMTQNLAFDLEAGQTLTPGTSDVSREWVVPESTSREIPSATAITETNPENWTAKSWSLGEYVYATPTLGDACKIAIHSAQELAGCTRFQNVETDWQPTFSAQDGTWGNYTGYVAADQSTKTYDARYLLGNYYQFNAATAGSGGQDVVSQSPNTDDTDQQLIDKLVSAEDSICPANWKLPLAGRRDFIRDDGKAGSIPLDMNDSYYQLLLAYGYPTADGYKTTDEATNAYVTLDNNSLGQRVDKSPLTFVRSGYIDLGVGALAYLGRQGAVVTSTVSNLNYQFNDSAIDS